MSAFALSAIDAQIEDCRATGHTGNVENLLEARAAFAELFEVSRRLADSLTDGTDSRQHHLAVRAGIARVEGGAA